MCVMFYFSFPVFVCFLFLIALLVLSASNLSSLPCVFNYLSFPSLLVHLFYSQCLCVAPPVLGFLPVFPELLVCTNFVFFYFSLVLFGICCSLFLSVLLLAFWTLLLKLTNLLPLCVLSLGPHHLNVTQVSCSDCRLV